MAYLHEQRLAQARKALYMLGNTKHKSKEQADAEKSITGLSGAVGTIQEGQRNDLKRRQAEAAARNLKEKQFDKTARDETEDVSRMTGEDYKQYLDDVSIISGNGPRDFNGPPMPEGVHWKSENGFDLAKNQLKLNAAAENAPVNGRFSGPGGEANKRIADDLTDDFHTSDNLMMHARILDQADRQSVAAGGAVPTGDRPVQANVMMAPPGMLGTNRTYRGGF